MVFEILCSARRSMMPLALLCACAAAPVAAQQLHGGFGGGPGSGPGPERRIGGDLRPGEGSSPWSTVSPAVAGGASAPATAQMPSGLVPFAAGGRVMPSYVGAPFGSPSQRYATVPSRSAADASADAAARRNGRMSERERRELRQNIEDVGRDVYRPRP